MLNALHAGSNPIKKGILTDTRDVTKVNNIVTEVTDSAKDHGLGSNVAYVPCDANTVPE